MRSTRTAFVAHTPASAGRSESALEGALRAFGYEVVTLHSGGDRFDAWAQAAEHRELAEREHVLFVSDQLIGPFDVDAFGVLLRDFESAHAEVWAATDSLQHVPHLQTELIGFNHGVLVASDLLAFFAKPPAGGPLERELALERAVDVQLLATAPWVPSERLVNAGEDPVARGGARLVAHGFPFVSRRALTDAVATGRLDELRAAVRNRFAVELDDWLGEGDLEPRSPAPAAPEPAAPADPPDGRWADFDRWVDRRSLKLKADFPPSWRRHLDRDADRPRLAVLVHVFYAELFPELLGALAQLPVPFDLIVTNASGRALTVDDGPLPLLNRAVVLDVANRGRDILPMAMVVNAGLLDPYELVLKLHTKRSAWREDHPDFDGTSGAEWRAGFLDQLVGSRQRVEEILAAFARDRRLGILTSTGSVAGPEHWGGDEHLVGELLRRLQLGLEPRELRFAAGSMYWIRGFLLQGLRALDLSPLDFEPEHGLIDGTTAHAVERVIGVLAAEAGYELADEITAEAGDADAWRSWLPDSTELQRGRVVPFYLPQFHTFPENDEWWGEGFTEWANVAAAQPVFPGHDVPLLPAELGFYDLLRDETVRSRQYELARGAGLAGFMYYHYWFAGKTLMSAPVEQLVASADPHPFCLMWANENWTRTWDGSADDILIAQEYETVPATRFIHDVLPLLKDERYLRVDGVPLLAVYKLGLVPDHDAVIAYWRRVAEEEGLGGLHLVTVDVGAGMGGIDGDAAAHGADAVLEFAPHNTRWVAQRQDELGVDRRFHGRIQSYAGTVDHAELKLLAGIEQTRYPGVMVEFDNTARRQWSPDLWWGANPFTFRRWLDAALAAVADREAERRIVFVNAWNEWAESAVLEPSQRWGRSYLLAVRDAITRLVP